MNSAAGARIAVLISFSGKGGVERMVLNLVDGFVARGHHVDLLCIRDEGVAADRLPPNVRLIDLGARHTLSSLPAVVRYLRHERPPALLVAKDRAGRMALLARGLAGVPTRIVIRLGTTLSAALEGRSAVTRWARYLPIRWSYRRADCIVAVSEGVRDDTLAVARLGPERVVVVRNPVISEQLSRLARESVEHPWLLEKDQPVLLGAGRLTRQKDFGTLLRAFACLHRERACRLIILGEGRDRHALEALARELGVADAVSLPGYTRNPYAYMGRADLFVLSSRWEGSPNVLTEAMALGTPVVATDCPSGPREILRHGSVAPLVAVGNVDALCAAMAQALDHPPDADTLRQATAEYTVRASTEHYLCALGLSAGTAA